jgi:hypothetical protein
LQLPKVSTLNGCNSRINALQTNTHKRNTRSLRVLGCQLTTSLRVRAGNNMARSGARFVLVAVLALLACAHAQSEVTAVATAPEQSQQKPAAESSPVMPVEGAVTSVMAVSNPEVATSSPSTSPAVEVTVAIQPTAVKDPQVEETAVVTTASTEDAHQTVQITAVPLSAEQPKPASGSEVSTSKVHTRGEHSYSSSRRW